MCRRCMRNHTQSSSRRGFLTAVGAGTIGAVAGCSDLLSDGDTITIGTASQGSSTFAAAQALQRAVSEHSDDLTLDAQTTDGFVANVRLFDDGEMDAIGLDNYTAAQAHNDEGPYEDDTVDDVPMQGFTFLELHIYPMAVDGSGIETTEDLPDTDFWPIQAGFATRLLTEDVLEEAGMWDDLDIVEIGTDAIAGSIEEGDVEAFAADADSYVDLPEYLTEVDTRADVHAVEVTDDFADAIEAAEGIGYAEVEPYGWEQDIGVDTLRAWTLDGQFRFGSDIDPDHVYELMRVSHEHVDTVQDSDPTYLDHSDLDTMTAAINDQDPVHPGAADFYKDHGVWNDNWTEGEI